MTAELDQADPVDARLAELAERHGWPALRTALDLATAGQLSVRALSKAAGLSHRRSSELCAALRAMTAPPAKPPTQANGLPLPPVPSLSVAAQRGEELPEDTWSAMFARELERFAEAQARDDSDGAAKIALTLSRLIKSKPEATKPEAEQHDLESDAKSIVSHLFARARARAANRDLPCEHCGRES